MRNIMAKKVGAVVVQRILHVPTGMRGNGLKRFLNTKQYNQEKTISEITLNKKQEKEFGATPNTNNMATKKATTAAATENKVASKKSAAKKAGAKKQAAKKATGKKGAAPKKVAVKKGQMRRLEKGEKGGKIAKIIALHREGKTNQEIIKKGFSPNTVAINVSLYKRGLLKIKY